MLHDKKRRPIITHLSMSDEHPLYQFHSSYSLYISFRRN
ncbi:hypothetical protein NBRC111894_1503 [Sporolactobacillus inulinus]|uniref:Uncharacterized protein n=1 Tax=Sporolactobacillus inulinus TaxID=2078 RepID=A0A4Y1ZA82_9BACL|nr:hypothetical protein NBRC111894_1503 [Sporolactobacillus inulinus]